MEKEAKEEKPHLRVVTNDAFAPRSGFGTRAVIVMPDGEEIVIPDTCNISISIPVRGAITAHISGYLGSVEIDSFLFTQEEFLKLLSNPEHKKSNKAE